MDLKKLIIAAVAFTIIANVVHIVGAAASMGYYKDPAYSGLWSSIMMPAAGPPPAVFFYISVVFGLTIALFYVYIYEVLKKSIPGKGLKKGLSYGAILVLLYTLPSTLTTLLLLNVPGGLIIEWAIEGLIVNMLGSVAIAKIME